VHDILGGQLGRAGELCGHAPLENWDKKECLVVQLCNLWLLESKITSSAINNIEGILLLKIVQMIIIHAMYSQDKRFSTTSRSRAYNVMMH
jgi:hypothetical protein